MFMNAEGIRVMVLFGIIALILLAGLLVAHLVWVVRLARAPELARRSGPARGAIVALALATPVVSFYVAGIAALWRDRASGAPASAARRLALVVGPTLGLAAIGAALVTSRYVPEGRTWEHVGRRFLGQACMLLVVEVLLFMIARVLLSKRSAAPWIAFAGTAAVLIVLLA